MDKCEYMPAEMGKKAPDFTLPDTDRKPRSLSEFLGKKAVLAFFPGAFTSVCTKELCAMRDDLKEYGNFGAQVAAISVDSPFANKGFAEANGITYPVLSDYSRNTIRAYGIVLSNFASLKGYDAAKRSVFVLDAKGIIRYRWISDDPGVLPKFEEIKEALKKIV